MRTHELETSERRELGTSPWLTVTQQQISLFADATGDHQWIHVDPKRASAGPFGSMIAHGYLLLSLVPQLIEQLVAVEDRTMGVNYGIDRVRFTSPVRAGSNVRARVALLRGARRDDEAILTTFEVTLEIEGQSRPAMVAELLSLSYGPALQGGDVEVHR